METRDLKALAALCLRRNQKGNPRETQSFHRERPAETTNDDTAPNTTVWLNPFSQGLPEARRESLRLVMEAIWEKAWADSVNKHGYEVTRSILASEDHITSTYHRVLSGMAELADFHHAINKWKQEIIAVIDKSGIDVWPTKMN